MGRGGHDGPRSERYVNAGEASAHDERPGQGGWPSRTNDNDLGSTLNKPSKPSPLMSVLCKALTSFGVDHTFGAARQDRGAHILGESCA